MLLIRVTKADDKRTLEITVEKMSEEAEEASEEDQEALAEEKL